MKNVALSFALAVAVLTPAAFAGPVTWTQWTGATAGTNGSATGTMGSTTVSYSGQTSGLGIGYAGTVGSFYPGESGTNWGPAGSYTGGGVDNAPPTSGNLVSLEGGNSDEIETITFSSAVNDPYLAIWSLGAGGNTASFVFSNPFSIVACGPSTEYGGGCVTESGNTLFGTEGNGVIQFAGSITSISFTTPDYENWYGFTAGETSATPEPGGLVLLGTGLLAAGLLFRRQLTH